MLMDIGADDISDVVVSLGDILKYSIHGKDVLVPLNEEVQYIESYLCIQKTGWKTAFALQWRYRRRRELVWCRS